jgi:hypothetical protein
MTTLAQLRKNKSAMLAKVTAAMDAQKNGSGGGNDNDDVRFWRPTRDAAGNGRVGSLRSRPLYKGKSK